LDANQCVDVRQVLRRHANEIGSLGLQKLGIAIRTSTIATTIIKIIITITTIIKEKTKKFKAKKNLSFSTLSDREIFLKN
jgi:hypothetical protein